MYEIRYFDARGQQIGSEKCSRPDQWAEDFAASARAADIRITQAAVYFLGSSDRSTPTFRYRIF